MADAAPQNSTTGRPRPLPIPPWVRRSFQVTAQVAPGIAAAWAERVFFTPPRARVRPEEAAALREAAPFILEAMGLTVRGWSWRGDGPAVLLVHGWGGHAGQMTPIARALASAGYRVLALDMPGHGASEGDRSSLVHYEQAIQAAARVFGPLHGVVAHSFGCAGTTFALSRAAIAKRAVYLAPAVGFQAFWDRFCQGLGVPAAVWERVITSSQAWLDVTWADVVPAVLAPRMSIPLQVIHDRADPEIEHRDGEELARLWPGARMTSTYGLGHNGVLRNPDVIQSVRAFLDGTEGSA